VPVVLHTDHAAKKWLPWISGLIDAGEQYVKEKGQPLFSSHMLDLSEEDLEENIETSVQYFKRMAPLGMAIEIELGVTGGEEDGVDNSGVENHRLYTQPEEVAHAYEELLKVGDLFTIAAAFGNVHGVCISLAMWNCVPISSTTARSIYRKSMAQGQNLFTLFFMAAAVRHRHKSAKPSAMAPSK
jgi:fructose/tagatose bisphosphate aldolase